MKQGFYYTIPIYFKLQNMLERVFANGKTQLIFSISASKKSYGSSKSALWPPMFEFSHKHTIKKWKFQTFFERYFLA